MQYTAVAAVDKYIVEFFIGRCLFQEVVSKLAVKIAYFILVAAAAYCCGNLNGAIITAQAQYHSDIRDMGSGNAGLSNFYRCYGAAKLSLVVSIDIGKAVVAVFVGGILMKDFGMQAVGEMVAMLFVIIGHMFPLAYGFRGGKGVLPACGAMFVVNWWLTLILVCIFVIIVAIARYSSLASITIAVLYPISIWFVTRDWAVTALAAVCAVLVIYKHRSNIQRLLNGTEAKLSFGKKQEE